MINRLPLFPLGAEVNRQGHLVISGCDIVELASEFDTPLYLFDEATLRTKCNEVKAEFGRRYSNVGVIYASKAFINRALAHIFMEEGLGLDVVSGGELNIARSAGFPMERVYFHGNNKSVEEIKLALDWRVGRIVVDNPQELDTLQELAAGGGRKVDILLRISPGIDPHTHAYIATGVLDSKFGFPLSRAGEAVALATKARNLDLVGLHFHIGSLIHEVGPYEKAIDVALEFAAEMERQHGFGLRELNVGGGYSIQYSLDLPSLPISAFAEAIAAKVTDKCQEFNLLLPRLIVEPGRWVVGQAGVAVYKVGAVKDIPGVRRYVSVDGGMGDNIRPALYGARYEAVVANKMRDEEAVTVTIAGRFCESGDILVRDIALPPVSPGDVIAIPDCGAYCLPMGSNYNASLKPPIILVRQGKARLLRRRETVADLTRCDMV